MTKQLLALSVALILLGGIAIALETIRLPEEPTLEGEDGTYICNADGKICPDGSVVGRSGPNCEFTECPGVVPNPTHELPSDIGILSGRVTLSPTCPVETYPPDPKCAPRSYVTDVLAMRKGTNTVAAETRTTSDGVYVHDLPAGTYIVRAKGGQVMPTCPDQEVTITGGTRTTLDISCDSGIR